ncbi:sulfite exporter TauE/SafE family protein [Metabacillus rhizolycopersici]|uniref:Probable membrane transporter protein n=1 Tax=Metabacillus rhizolycopersici TaxID=2875709 RepID=A0ABS7UUS9_9BACI|nr:sulfite exporter TauE/SafE family protein [Metabacillus rhizolycopersici]MBZ5752038.1 sulfite exporter TauE/SafE family protein [Metabacillus rhizolycopersici]
MTIVITMLFLGLVLGFVGAGGSGFIIAVLVTIFNVPIHAALGTAVTVMFFSVLVGSLTHLREGSVNLRLGILIGIIGGGGSYLGSQIAIFIHPNVLLVSTVTILIISGVLLWVQTRFMYKTEEIVVKSFSIHCVAIGLGNGVIAGTFGIGAAPFIQLSLMRWLDFPMRIAAGTTMLVILPISMFASVGYIQNGNLDFLLFLKVVSGIMVGTYIGAKLTKRLPSIFLRYAMVITPVASAILLVINFL